MSLVIKQISALEKVRLGDELNHKETNAYTVLQGQRLSYQVAIDAKHLKWQTKKVWIESELSDCVRVYSVKEVVVDKIFREDDPQAEDYIITEPGRLPDVLVPIEHQNNLATLSDGNIVFWVKVDVPAEWAKAGKDKADKPATGERAELVDFGYVDCVNEAFSAVQKIKREDCDLLFILMSTYVPSAVAAPFARYLEIPQILVGIQPLPHLDYQKATTYMQLVNDDVCAMPEVAGVYGRLGKQIPPCIVAAKAQSDYLKREISEWVDATCALAAFKYETFGYLGHTYEGIIMDPPSYGRGPNGEIWKLEDSIDELLELTSKLLSDKPLFFLLNSYTTGLSAMTMHYLVDLKIGRRFGGFTESGELGLRVSSTGGFLPCGASSRWVFER